VSSPKYPVYKDSGVDWLGAVPRHWAIQSLKRHARLLTEKTDRREHPVALENIESWTGRFIPTETEFEGEGVAFDGGDILFGKLRPYLAKALVAESSGEAVGDFLVMRPKPAAVARFLAYQLRSREFISIVDGSTFGSKMPRASWDFVGAMQLTLPPAEEQRSIADFLDHEISKIDTLVEEQKRLIDLLKEKRQVVISQAVTKGLDPSAPMKESAVEWLGKVPAHWHLARLKFVAKVQTGVAKGKDNIGKVTVEVPYLRVANVQDGYLDLDEVSTIEIPADDLPRYRLRAGDVLMNEGGDFDKLGRGHVWDGSIDPCIHQNHVFAVRPLGISPRWLNAVTSSDYAQFYFMSRSKQSTNLASISSTNLMELPVVIPTAVEQEALLNAIDAQCATCDRMIESGQSAIQLLLERRSALVTAAVTGKIDVRNVALKEAKVEELAT